MRRLIVLFLAASTLTLGACGTESSIVPASTPTTAPATAPVDEWTPSPEEIAHDDWLQGGPMATSMPTRTCVQHSPTDEELATTDPDDVEAYSWLFWSSCFSAENFETAPPDCNPPSDATEGYFVCAQKSLLTQRVVDDWYAFADAEDTASAERQGLSLEQYRAQNPDQE